MKLWRFMLGWAELAVAGLGFKASEKREEPLRFIKRAKKDVTGAVKRGGIAEDGARRRHHDRFFIA